MSKTIQRLSLPSPAKINRFLHIVGRRADGYHELQTLFLLLDYGDTLHFERQSQALITIVPERPDLPTQENLIYRAANALLHHAGLDKPPCGLKITLEKRLPMGGGLGGGSSNAATALHGLNHLWNLKLSTRELAEIGLSLGADVPVFVHGRTAWAEGIGEKLTPIPLNLSTQNAREYWFVIVKPDCSVSTPVVFCDERLTRDTPKRKIAPAVQGIGREHRNDCEPVVKALFPKVQIALSWLEQYAPARLTGTGACIFAEFSTKNEAERVLSAMPAEWTGFVAKAIEKSPLIQSIERYTD